MSLIVETGEGVLNADAYCSVEQCDAYHQKMGQAGWPSTDSTSDVILHKEVAIRQATSYIDTRFVGYLNGKRATDHQGLLWPRVGCSYYNGESIPHTLIPTQLVQACMEAALLSIQNVKLYSDVQAGPLLTSKNIAGAISKTWDVSTYSQQPFFGKITNLLLPIFGPLSATSETLSVVSLIRGV